MAVGALVFYGLGALVRLQRPRLARALRKRFAANRWADWLLTAIMMFLGAAIAPSLEARVVWGVLGAGCLLAAGFYVYRRRVKWTIRDLLLTTAAVAGACSLVSWLGEASLPYLAGLCGAAAVGLSNALGADPDLLNDALRDGLQKRHGASERSANQP
jgi:hypothetical protein